MNKMIASIHHIDLSPNGITISQPYTSSVICVYMCMNRGSFHHWRPGVRRPSLSNLSDTDWRDMFKAPFFETTKIYTYGSTTTVSTIHHYQNSAP